MRYGVLEASFRYRGFVGAVFAFAAAGAAVVVGEFTPPAASASSAMVRETLAWCLFVLGAVFRVWSTLYIGGKKNHNVVQEGPYSLCRNPLYVGSYCLFLSAALFFQSRVVLAGALIVIAYYQAAVIPAEEKKLRQVLGAPYERYCAAVPRILPSPAGFRTRAQFPVNVAALRREARRMAVWVWIPLAARLLYG